ALVSDWLPLALSRNYDRPRVLNSKTVFFRELAQRKLGAGAEMLDDFGRGQRAKPAAAAVVDAAPKTTQKTGGEQIAHAGRNDDPLDRERGYRLDPFRADNETTLLAARHDRGVDIGAQCDDSTVEVRCLIQAVQLRIVGEDEIERAGAHQL